MLLWGLWFSTYCSDILTLENRRIPWYLIRHYKPELEPGFACPQCRHFLGAMLFPTGNGSVVRGTSICNPLVYQCDRYKKKQCNFLFQIKCLEADSQMMKVFQDTKEYDPPTCIIFYFQLSFLKQFVLLKTSQSIQYICFSLGNTIIIFLWIHKEEGY